MSIRKVKVLSFFITVLFCLICLESIQCISASVFLGAQAKRGASNSLIFQEEREEGEEGEEESDH